MSHRPSKRDRGLRLSFTECKIRTFLHCIPAKFSSEEGWWRDNEWMMVSSWCPSPWLTLDWSAQISPFTGPWSLQLSKSRYHFKQWKPKLISHHNSPGELNTPSITYHFPLPWRHTQGFGPICFLISLNILTLLGVRISRKQTLRHSEDCKRFIEEQPLWEEKNGPQTWAGRPQIACGPDRVPPVSMESSTAEMAVRGILTVWKWSGPVLLPCSVIVWGPPEKSVTLARS